MNLPVPSSRVRAACSVVCAALVLSACASRSPAPDASAAGSQAPATAGSAGSADTGAAASAGAAGRDAGTSSAGAGTMAGAPRDMSVYFEFDSSTLSPGARALVQEHAEFLAGRRQPVRLEGNADERGSREYNIALGQRRAESVRQVLTLRGLPADGVEAVSYGEERSRCTDGTDDCFASNRRVDFIYSR